MLIDPFALYTGKIVKIKVLQLSQLRIDSSKRWRVS